MSLSEAVGFIFQSLTFKLLRHKLFPLLDTAIYRESLGCTHRAWRQPIWPTLPLPPYRCPLRRASAHSLGADFALGLGGEFALGLGADFSLGLGSEFAKTSWGFLLP